MDKITGIIILIILGLVPHINGQDTLGIYIPEKTEANAARYDHYKSMLLSAYAGSYEKKEGDILGDKHNKFISYFHLDAPADTVFKYLEDALTYDPIRQCYHLFYMKFNFNKMREGKYFPDKMKDLKCYCDSIHARLDSTLIDILSVIKMNDQKYRGDDNFAPWRPGTEAYWEEQSILDLTNQQLIEKIIDRHGYPGRYKVGLEHEEIAFLVIQHADLKIQEKYARIIKDAVENQQLERRYYALLIDRIRMRRNLPQIYGTQLVHNKKRDRLELYKMESLEGIDQLRAKYGLSTLRSYLEHTGAFMPEN